MAVDLGLKGPEPGSGGHEGTTCDNGKGKGTRSVLVLLLLSLVAPPAPALALALGVVPAAAKEGSWRAVLAVVVVVVGFVVVMGQCLGGDTSLTEPSVVHHQIVIVMDPEPESESRSQLEPHGSIFGSARAASPPIRTFGV